MSVHHLDRVFKPASVAIIVAGDQNERLGSVILRNLMGGGYEGRLLAVNFQGEEISGVKHLENIMGINEQVDLAIIAAPGGALMPIIEECALRRICGVMVLPSAEEMSGMEVPPMPDEIWAKAHGTGMRILGPGSCGIMLPAHCLNASLFTKMALRGGLALVSQSRALLGALLDMSLAEGIGFSHLVSAGAMVDVDLGDLLNYLGNDPQVSGIALHVERLTNARKFMIAARAVSLVKPIVVLPGTGMAQGGCAGVVSHAAGPGRDAIFDAAFSRAGILKVNTLKELLEYPGLMVGQPRLAGLELAVISNSRGLGLLAADTLFRYGMKTARLGEESLARLKALLPDQWNGENPIDVGDSAAPALTREVLDICMDAPEVNGVLMVYAPLNFEGSVALAEAISSDRGHRRVPLIAAWLGGKGVEDGREVLRNADIRTTTSLEDAAGAFEAMCRHARNQEVLREIPSRLTGDLGFNRDAARAVVGEGLKEKAGRLNELDTRSLLAAYGIPVPPIAVARSEEEAAREALVIGYPVVVKIHSPDIANKGDAQCVFLDLRNETEVRQAFRQALDNALLHFPTARILGVTLQPMIRGRGVELILGSFRDELFGPVIAMGVSGPLGGHLHCPGAALPPLNHLLARRLLGETGLTELLQGQQGAPGPNLVLLEEILIRLSHLVSDFPEISSLYMDPLLQEEEGFWVLDAKAILHPADLPAPRHLVVSPYPAQYERQASAKDGLPIMLRPIKPEDASMLLELFKTLSPTSIYFRFFRPVQTLSHEMLARFTQIDYDRDVVLVAIQQGAGAETMVGVVRLMRTSNVTKAEFAIVVGDPWQGRGVGAVLLEHCLGIAAERGIKTVWGMVLPENTTMIDLGRKVGFSVRRIPGAKEYELCIDLDARSQDSE